MTALSQAPLQESPPAPLIQMKRESVMLLAYKLGERHLKLEEVPESTITPEPAGLNVQA